MQEPRKESGPVVKREVEEEVKVEEQIELDVKEEHTQDDDMALAYDNSIWDWKHNDPTQDTVLISKDEVLFSISSFRLQEVT